MAGQPSPSAASLAAAVSYAAGVAATGTAALLLLTQIRNWRRERAMICVILAIGVGLLTDVGSVAANVRGYFRLANVDDLFSCWGYVLFIYAAMMERGGGGSTRQADSERSATSFIPVFAILVALSVVLGVTVSPFGASRWAAAIVVVAGASLLLVRQLGLRYQLGRLNAALLASEADARITELVRSSRDLFLIVGDDERVRFSSATGDGLIPAAQQELNGRLAATLLGSGNARAVAMLIGQARAAGGSPVSCEVELPAATGSARTIQVVGRSEVGNPRISGIVLTMRDVTEQRSAERAVTEVAARERREMAHEVHEVIGQELAGIAYTIQSLATERGAEVASLQAGLAGVAGDVRQTIADLQALALELAPLAVFQGSLESALDHFGSLIQRRCNVSVLTLVQDHAGDAIASAEQLYYLAREAIERAATQPGCRTITVEIEREADMLVLSVRDDAPSREFSVGMTEDASLRMLRNRARLMGGGLAVDRMPGLGSRILARIPLRRPPGDEA